MFKKLFMKQFYLLHIPTGLFLAIDFGIYDPFPNTWFSLSKTPENFKCLRFMSLKKLTNAIEKKLSYGVSTEDFIRHKLDISEIEIIFVPWDTK